MDSLTLTILKPDSIRQKAIGDMIKQILDADFEIIAMKMIEMDKEMASKFYDVHKEKPFFDELIEFMTSGKCIPMVLKKENCIEDFRTLIGNYDPENAADGTIRHSYGTDVCKNAVHGSDSVEHSKREIHFFFNDEELKAAGCSCDFLKES